MGQAMNRVKKTNLVKTIDPFFTAHWLQEMILVRWLVWATG